ncbi:DNA repair protein REV1 isoform X2 [Prunus dulcis]|uniref:DNA repair protein REV1 isoform X2 n=1 Tax=Prunus dulcis TaxID=3755 RepID=UPI001482C5CA|nr:DNA repair protein REV1 isoform X2 [Prunus dulcis]
MSLNSSLSAGSSGQRSKRSFNSNSSNHSANSNSKKKKTTNQKTLGASWGANSHSSSRSSFKKSPFSDFGSYMVEKNRKLHNQFDSEASSSSHNGLNTGKNIFRGVSIFVDGYTVPSSQELRGYMLNYGGRYENYFSRHRVTHIICSNLPDSKVKNLRSFSGGLPVVKPSWVLDSISANKHLSWVPYQLDQLACNQPRLSAFFAPKIIPDSGDALRDAANQVKYENEDTSLVEARLEDADESEVCRSTEHRWQISGESDNVMFEKNNEESGQELHISSVKDCEMRIVEMTTSAAEDDGSVKDELQYSTHQTSALASSCRLPTSSNAGSNQSHSTLGDPNFVENYFKSSRLHFIGTWRNRYRKRFPRSSKGFKRTEPNLSASASSTAIIHIDMDCFFVSVVIRKRSELKDRPVAVCHSDSPKGTAEISSANYPARDYGVKAGMFVRNAKALCPHLVIIPYDFEAYEEVADQFYDILHKHSNKVQAVSCDEAFLDVTDAEGLDPEVLASTVRKEIFETTGCTASAGISRNMLMARLATRTAKPDGQCYISPEKVDDYLHQLPIKELPGIGYTLEEKLKKQNVQTCGQLRMISKDSLQKDFGMKTGEMLWNHSRGIDNRLVGVIQESKSIGAEVNWGVRFKDLKDSQYFLSNLCKEVSLRLQGCGVLGRTFTLKIKKRRKDAGEPVKYMGHGDCENLSHSVTVPVATDDVEVLQRIAKQLFGSFSIDVKDIRGIGLQVSKLENADTSKQGFGKNSLKSWLMPASRSREEQSNFHSVAGERVNVDCEDRRTDGTSGQLCDDSLGVQTPVGNHQSSGEPTLNQVSAPPPLCHLDLGVIECLPPEIFTELNGIYGGVLVDFVAKNKRENTSATVSHKQANGARNGGGRPLFNDVVPGNEIAVENEQSVVEKQAIPSSVGESSHVAVSTSGPGNTDIMPSSLSQVDTSVLQQLPEELRVDILEQLPAHRRHDVSSSAALGPLVEKPIESLDVSNGDHSGPSDPALNHTLWIGNPPGWVDEFKSSKCMVLNVLAEMYYKSGSSGNLSAILRNTILESHYPLDSSSDSWIEAVYSFSDLLRQYIKSKIDSDIEEIYVCFRLLKRFTMNSKFFLQVYNNVFPYLQASVTESYGGNLHI